MTLTDNVVELAARAICQRELANYDCERACMAVHKCVGKLSECVIADACAALEAARYGELAEELRVAKDAVSDLRGYIVLLEDKIKQARALLSTIGESNLKGDR